MCGIAGIVHVDRSRCVPEHVLTAMRDSMMHRGPNGAGIFLDQECGLAHRRLSILDLSDRAAQPFVSADGRHVIIFNGEVFNYRELRSVLQAEGVVFRTASDTEVLLYLFLRHGERCLGMLNGMFAFAVWNSVDRSLFLARDRVGVKPFYYTLTESEFLFASEPKALFKAGVSSAVNQDAMEELLLFKYVAGEQTVFKNVKRLLPGHCAWLKNGHLQISRWWNLPEKIQANRERILSNPFTWFEETFYSAVKYRTISDVPVGLMLSGGLDSSSVAAALCQNGERNLSGFTFTFDDPLYNEEPLAKEVSARFGLSLNAISSTHDELIKAMHDAAWFYDEPLVHQNDAQMLLLSREAKKKVTVLLSGEGADELMGGYVRYKTLRYYPLLKGSSFAFRLLQHIPSTGIVNRFEKMHRYLKGNQLNELVLLNATNIFPADLHDLGVQIDLEKFTYRNNLLKEAAQVYPDEPARQAMYMDLFVHMSSVLDRNDRMTMGAGIECRVPFLDYRFLEQIPAIPSKYLLKGRKGKYLLFDSVGKSLPDSVRKFRKLGFSVPWNSYLKDDNELGQYIVNIRDGSLAKFFPHLRVDQLFRQGVNSTGLNQALIRQLLMIELWSAGYLKRL
jgi:asparagine synthase (glutamine-hydrolysing)